MEHCATLTSHTSMVKCLQKTKIEDKQQQTKVILSADANGVVMYWRVYGTQYDIVVHICTVDLKLPLNSLIPFEDKERDLMLLGSFKEVSLYDVEKKEILVKWNAHVGRVEALLLCDGLLWTASNDGIGAWDISGLRSGANTEPVSLNYTITVILLTAF